MKPYVYIRKDFFSNNGELFNGIGGRNGFALYCLITNRKNIDNKMHITIREINRILSVSKNITHARERILNFLNLLKTHKLIHYDFDVNNIKNNDFIEILWCNNIDKENRDHIKFYADDFDLFEKIGVIPYAIMWLVRMTSDDSVYYANISQLEMSNILKCRLVDISNAIRFFTEIDLFHVERRGVYNALNKTKNQTNGYKYTGLTKRINGLTKEDVEHLINNRKLHSSTNKGFNIESFYSSGIDASGCYGIYFIYDKNEKLAYIGKSLSCVVKRCFQSVVERSLEDFSKIEIMTTNSKVDTNIYEGYYIQKHQPYLNIQNVYEDEDSNLLIPDLKVQQVFQRV